MINHTRTLLLNARVPLDMTYMDPEFNPVDLSGTPVQGVSAILFPSGASKVLGITSVLCVLHRPELEAYTLAFDSRITYVPGQQDGVQLQQFISACLVQRPSELTKLVARISNSATLHVVAPALFVWPEDSQRAAELSMLKRAWSSPQDELLSVGALILAMAYQTERLRVSR